MQNRYGMSIFAKDRATDNRTTSAPTPAAAAAAEHPQVIIWLSFCSLFSLCCCCCCVRAPLLLLFCWHSSTILLKCRPPVLKVVVSVPAKQRTVAGGKRRGIRVAYGSCLCDDRGHNAPRRFRLLAARLLPPSPYCCPTSSARVSVPACEANCA